MQENLSLSQLTKKLFETNVKLDKKDHKSQLLVNKIKLKYDPRNQFNTWKTSQEGKQWKKQKYQQQQNCCSICKKKIELKGSHIDHIKPISKYPNLSLTLSNLQIACWQCNTSKSNR